MLKKMAGRSFPARLPNHAAMEVFYEKSKIPGESDLRHLISDPVCALRRILLDSSLIFFYVGWLCAVALAWQFIRIMSTVRNGTPFVYQNVRSLRYIALFCGICALDFLFALFFHPSIAFGFCAAILCFGCLCALVLGSVFAQSVQYKEENDLTI